jgi:hypothetical protein
MHQWPEEARMNRVRTVLVALGVGLSAGLVFAQAASGPGPRPGPGPRAAGMAGSAPGMGMGMGPGARGGRGPAARWGSDATPGWALMTDKERAEHRDRMRSMKNYDECKSYQEQHHAQMAARVKDKGGKPLAEPRRDACAGLKR